MTPNCVNTKSVFFVNAWVDAFFIGGASILGLALTYSIPWVAVGTFGTLSVYLSWLVNWPHFAATNFRFFQSRQHMRQFPITAFVIPVLLLGVALAALNSPDLMAPYLIKVFALWSPYHFAAQTFGITLIYAKRTGYLIGAWERRAISGFIFGNYLFQAVRVDVHKGSQQLFGIVYPLFGLPPILLKITMIFTYGSAALFVLLAARNKIKGGRWPKWPMLLPALTQYLWFLFANQQSFQIFVPLFHSLQYLLIAWSMQMAGAGQPKIAESRSHQLISRTAKWMTINIAIGVALFFLLPKFFTLFGWPVTIVTAVLAACVQIHHFFVDGVIWKLRPGSGNAALTANVRQQADDGLPSRMVPA